VPIEKPEPVSEEEINPSNSEDIFPQVDFVIDTVNLNETTNMAVVVVEEKLNNSTDDDFDLDFNETESEVDDTPDFF
ncbi:MAG: hypothetical protein ACK56F_02400, partial [bacterium]